MHWCPFLKMIGVALMLNLTRARPGGAHMCPPIGFSQIAEKMGGAQRRQIWHSCSFILCASCVKILAPGHIRSGLQVTLSDVTSKRNLATLTPCHSHSYKPSLFKLLEVDEVNSSSNLYISDFLYSWPEVRSISWPVHVNLRPAGGGGCLNTPPCGFSRIARKRRRAAPPGFHLPYPPSFWQLLWKFRSWVMQGQVTRSGQVTIPYKNFTIAPQLQCLRES